jgi:chemotaxis protein CheC
MSLAGFAADEADALKELANVGMGRSAFALNQLLHIEVDLSIPHLYTIPVEDLGAMLGRPEVTVLRQPFTEAFDGEVLAIFDRQSRTILEPLAEDMSHEEFMLEVTNIIAAAFLGSIAEQLKRPITFLPPAVLSNPQQSEHLVELTEMQWKEALIVDVAMNFGAQTAVCKLLLIFPEAGRERISSALSQFLNA